MTTDFAAQGAARLSDWGVIRASGADAATFLHGQLTSSVTTLDGSQARLAGYCSAKGRLLASFVMWKAADGDVLLACHGSLLAATLKRLSMFVLRARCTLSDAGAELPLWGLAGAPASAVVDGLAVWGQRQHAGGSWIRLPDAAGRPRALQAGSAAAVAALAAPALDIAVWRWLDVCSGVATLEAATADQFVPQMLNFELLGGVDFQKGCYPGQEVVARSQYRGTLKRRTFRFSCTAQAAAGQELFHSGDPLQPAGIVCNAAPRPAAADGSAGAPVWDLLAEVKLAALDGGSWHLGRLDGPPMTLETLPYEVSAGGRTAP